MLTRVTVPALAAGEGDGWASRHARQGRAPASSTSPPPFATGSARIAIGCVSAVPVVVEAERRRGRGAQGRGGRRPRPARATSTPPPTTGATSRRCSRWRAVEQALEERSLMAEPVTEQTISVDDQRRGLRAGGRGAQAARPLHPRRRSTSPARTSAATPATAAPAPSCMDGKTVKSLHAARRSRPTARRSRPSRAWPARTAS